MRPRPDFILEEIERERAFCVNYNLLEEIDTGCGTWNEKITSASGLSRGLERSSIDTIVLTSYPNQEPIRTRQDRESPCLLLFIFTLVPVDDLNYIKDRAIRR